MRTQIFEHSAFEQDKSKMWRSSSERGQFGAKGLMNTWIFSKPVLGLLVLKRRKGTAEVSFKWVMDKRYMFCKVCEVFKSQSLACGVLVMGPCLLQEEISVVTYFKL